MQLIENEIKLTKYIDISITDKSFDDIDNQLAQIDVVFTVNLANRGIVIDIYEIKSVRWSYTGIKYTEGENLEQEIEGSSDETWTINPNKSKSDDENYGLFVNDITINLETKTIDIDFEC
jgi:hypothetical protein